MNKAEYEAKRQEILSHQGTDGYSDEGISYMLDKHYEENAPQEIKDEIEELYKEEFDDAKKLPWWVSAESTIDTDLSKSSERINRALKFYQSSDLT